MNLKTYGRRLNRSWNNASFNRFSGLYSLYGEQILMNVFVELLLIFVCLIAAITIITIPLAFLLALNDDKIQIIINKLKTILNRSAKKLHKIKK